MEPRCPPVSAEARGNIFPVRLFPTCQFPELIAAARASIEVSDAPLNYRQEVLPELQIIDRICGLARPEMKTVEALVRRVVVVMNEFDPVTADGLRAWVNKNQSDPLMVTPAHRPVLERPTDLAKCGTLGISSHSLSRRCGGHRWEGCLTCDRSL